MTTIRIESRKIDMYYQMAGQGPIKLLLIMGLGTTHIAWRELVPSLLAANSQLQICIFDNRGCGRTSCTFGRYTTSQMAQDARGLLTSIGGDWATNPIHVVGVSMGGMIAMELGLLLINDNRLGSLSLFVTTPGGSVGKSTPTSGKKLLLRSLITGKPEVKAPIIAEMLFSEEYLNSERNGEINRTRLYREMIQIWNTEPPLTLTGYFAQVAACMTHSVSEERLRQIKNSGVPIAIATGTDDHLVDPENSRYLRTILEPKIYVEWERTGHAVHLAKVNEITQIIISLITN
eukprot:TRINITY_DN2730_c0_g3_i1.p1 TRINITY_DN2730_c0_g3~~TRINITY_DN2730_c0_g3_i1.p1  ORF type:complete len:290 (-),score=118.66 TRINITY_DN2730_c0_g3_i1:113-982(-)